MKHLLPSYAWTESGRLKTQYPIRKVEQIFVTVFNMTSTH